MYSVFTSFLFKASSASSAMLSIQFLLFAFILLLTSLSFSVYFVLICLLTLSDRVLGIIFSDLFPSIYKVPWFVTDPWFLFSFVVNLEIFLQPQGTPSPSLESHALFLRLPLLLALHLQAPGIRAMLNVLKMFSLFSLVVSYLTLILSFSFGWLNNLNFHCCAYKIMVTCCKP